MKTVFKQQLPNTWRWVTLGDILIEKPCNGLYKSENFIGKGVLFLDINGLYKSLKADFSQARRVEVTKDEYQKYELIKDDILINRVSKKPEGIGKAVVVNKIKEPTVYESNMIRIRIDKQQANSVFIVYYLSSKLSRKELLSKANIANQASINQEAIKSLSIPLPPLEEQCRIVAILDKADIVRRKRQQAIALTEELLRSAFLEMFGDPVTNSKRWLSGTILDVVANPKRDVRCGPFGTQLKVEEIVSEGIPLLGIENVKGGKFRPSIKKYLTPFKAKELMPFNVQYGDVLVTRMGTIGHACVVPQELGEARFSYHLFRIRPNPNKCLPGFLASTITWSGTFLTQLERLSHGAIMAGLKTADLKEVRFLVPPIDLQKEYLKIVSEVEKLLENQSKHMICDEDLFNSLLQKAFQGNL